MRIRVFALRNAKELLRDPLSLGFSPGFPLILLFLLSLISSNVPVEMFSIELLSPGVAVFGISFLSLFSGLILVKDRTDALLQRLFISPIKASDFLLGYFLPYLPMAIAQTSIWFNPALAEKAFETAANLLPFRHAVNAGRYAYAGEYAKLWPELGIVSIYAVLLGTIAVFCFTGRMKQNSGS